MSFAPSEGLRPRWFRRFGVGLNAWYTLVLTTGLVVTYLMVVLLARYAVERADEQILLAKLEEYRSRLDAAPLSDPTRELPVSLLSVEDEAFLLQVFDESGTRLFVHLPDAALAAVSGVRAAPSSGEPHAWTRIRGGRDGRLWTLVTTEITGGRRLQLGMSSAHSDELVRRLRETLLIGFGPLLILGLLGGAYLTRRAQRPIQDLFRVMRAIEVSGDLRARAEQRATGDELDELIALFNRLMSKQERLVTAMRESLDNVAHDLRTPLTRLRGSAETALAGEAGPDTLRDALADCLEEADRVGGMLETLMDISEARSGAVVLAKSRFALDTIAREAVDLYEYVAEDRGIEVTCALEPGVEVVADRMRLFRAVANLLDNALKYTPSGRGVRVLVRSAGEVAEIEVADEGPGIEAEDEARIWERLYRADKSRSEVGLGLGLSFVKAIVEAHGGAVGVVSEPGEGARFIVKVPAAPAGS